MAIHGGPSPSPFPQPRSGAERALAATYKSIAAALLAHFYLNWTTPLHRAAGCVAAIAFIFIETLWTTIAHEDPASGAVSFRGWRGSFGHSSFAQFWANVLFAPMLLFWYRSLLPNNILRVVLFPLNVWWLEIVEGYIIMFFFGRNVAWEYRGQDALFHGNIKMQYAILWTGLGLLVELLWDPFLLPAAQLFAFDREYFTATTLLVAAVTTLSWAPRMGIAGILKSASGR